MRLVQRVSCALYIVVLLLDIVGFRIAIGMNVNIAWMAALGWRRFLDLAWPVCLLVWIGSSIALYFMTRKRSATQQSAQNAIRSQSTSPPAVHAAYRSTSILALVWTMTYRNAVWQNAKQIFIQPRSWITFAVTGVIFALFFGGYDTSDPSFYTSHIEAFMAGLAISAVVGVVQIAIYQRKHFPANASVQHLGLILEPTGIRSVIGNKVYSYPWDVIGSVRSLGGTVLYQRHGIYVLIPEYAFRSIRDGKAFVATVDALKKGLPPPPYDWTAYVPHAPSTEGIWPPPIMS